ncbi:MAG: ArsC family (seleno)protein [Candidatus Obscuribacterales bacterium]
MKSIDWLYHRKNCETCAKAQDFFTRHKISAKEIVDARKQRLDPAQALKLAARMDEIYVTRGKKVLHFDMKRNAPDKQELSTVLIGPSGNLRAPAMVLDKTLVVGFDESTYDKVFK